MQAFVERTSLENPQQQTSSFEQMQGLRTNSIEYNYIQEVISGCCSILNSSADVRTLRFAPVRIFIRITWSSVFLLKAISLGVWSSKFQEAMSSLDASIKTLRGSCLDDLHLASKYATLIERHVDRIKRSFLATSSGDRPAQQVPLGHNNTPVYHSAADTGPQSQHMQASQNLYDFKTGQQFPSLGYDAQGQPDADPWLSLPFDPSMAPFRLEVDSQTGTFPGLEGDALDFIWDLVI